MNPIEKQRGIIRNVMWRTLKQEIGATDEELFDAEDITVHILDKKLYNKYLQFQKDKTTMTDTQAVDCTREFFEGVHRLVTK